MNKIVNIKELDILKDATKLELIELFDSDKNYIHVNIVPDDKVPIRKIDIFQKKCGYFYNDRDKLVDIILEKYLRNAIINDLYFYYDSKLGYNTISIRCTNKKEIVIRYAEEYTIVSKAINILDKYKNYDFYKRYEENKNKIDNIIFLNSDIYSYVTFIKNDKETIEGNNLYITVPSNKNNLEIFSNKKLITEIMNDFYSKNYEEINGMLYNKNDKILTLNFSNNKNILFLDCRDKYQKFIEQFKDDLIDKKVGKVYKKGEKHE